MTRSVEIPDEAVEAAKNALDALPVCLKRSTVRIALEAALPYLAPAGDGGLREALENYLLHDGIACDDNPAYNEGIRVMQEGIRALLRAHPAAPAVPQPVDREALRAHLLKAEVVRAEGGYWDTPTPQEAGRMADAVLAVLAGEQEQVERG